VVGSVPGPVRKDRAQEHGQFAPGPQGSARLRHVPVEVALRGFAPKKG
jgi:hypothetical protein